jgi:hypothetical protein
VAFAARLVPIPDSINLHDFPSIVKLYRLKPAAADLSYVDQFEDGLFLPALRQRGDASHYKFRPI